MATDVAYVRELPILSVRVSGDASMRAQACKAFSALRGILATEAGFSTIKKLTNARFLAGGVHVRLPSIEKSRDIAAWWEKYTSHEAQNLILVRKVFQRVLPIGDRKLLDRLAHHLSTSSTSPEMTAFDKSLVKRMESRLWKDVRINIKSL